MEKAFLTDSEFEKIVQIIRDASGIHLSDSKRDLVVNRILKRYKSLGLSSFSAYMDYLESGGVKEMSSLVDAITTNLTYFFREVHHFEYLERTLLPEFYATRTDDVFRIYSAGCSSGEEVVSCAIVCERFKQKNEDFSYEIVAVDIDTKMIKFANDGVYSEESLMLVSDSDRRLVFDRGTGGNRGFYRVKPDVKKNIRFLQQSIMERPKVMLDYDLIFCRNVLIYFSEESALKVLSAFRSVLKKDGLLFLGHSENMVGKQDFFELITRTMYRASQ